MELILIIIGCIALVLIIPFLSFIEGWFIGWLIKIVFGATFVSGLKMFNINIDANSIPLLCGTLSIIGSFFRTGVIPKNKNKELINNKSH